MNFNDKGEGKVLLAITLVTLGDDRFDRFPFKTYYDFDDAKLYGELHLNNALVMYFEDETSWEESTGEKAAPDLFSAYDCYMAGSWEELSIYFREDVYKLIPDNDYADWLSAQRLIEKLNELDRK